MFNTDAFAGKKVLITGGAGFIGSNLAVTLIQHGAQVTVADAMIPAYGGNLFNLDTVKERVNINFCDIREVNTMNYLVRDQDFIFHLAGQMDHVLSLSDPFPDIDINIKGTAVIMEACKHFNPQARVIYTGTRGQYGPAISLPVNETAPTYPKGIHEISRLAAEKIIQVYNDVYKIRSVMLRLTNIYGPRAQMRHHRYGVANWFIRKAVDDETISIFGDGKILRDFLYVDDCIDAMMRCALNEKAYGEIFNVGVDSPTTFAELAKTIIRVAGTGRWEYTPFSAERAAQEPGDFYSDISKIRQVVGWGPETSLEEGINCAIEYYRLYKQHYW